MIKHVLVASRLLPSIALLMSVGVLWFALDTRTRAEKARRECLQLEAQSAGRGAAAAFNLAPGGTIQIIPTTGEQVPLPTTDEDVARLLEYNDSTLTTALRGLYRVYRAQGMTVLQAYDKVLTDFVVAIEKRQE